MSMSVKIGLFLVAYMVTIFLPIMLDVARLMSR